MNELDRNVELVRARLHRAVADVEPAPDALPTLLAAARRRRAPYRRPTFLVVAAAVVVAVFAGVAVGVQTPDPQPVSVRPGNYVAAVEDGVIASFDVATGREQGEVARITGGEVTELAGDRGRVFAAVSTPEGGRVVEVAAEGQRPLAAVRGPRALAARGGRVAYAEDDGLVVWSGGTRRVLPTPGMRVLDLALTDGGRLALLAERGGRSELLLTGPDPATVDGARAVGTGRCAPLAVTGSGQDIAALEPADCDAPGRARVATYAADSGRKLAAGAPFAMPPVPPGEVGLSVDAQGRTLVSAPGAAQWLVDGPDVLPIPLPCATPEPCTTLPATF
ncbi:hypothetical protein EIL87_03835 [Saccharopolyspora rhizosphaerae]|uniref:FbpC C-terminal regulatory nucleotide binding domain-containing protein n=1 Tax=Saccharopolyspora rhizosphaerae TaxID=2492662 RepID=A0A3R8P9E9_9PSEU|nr:hypothetical protein [Saccharopolyspora rhizosphaerae]RRO19254.1 hypothetical protein EIL87_03835 [Saccharopolyspora rhizosphaerae]